MASRCQQVTWGFNTCALELAYAVKYNNLCERWESCQKKKSKCSLLSSAPNLHMALGFQNSKIIYTGEPSLKKHVRALAEVGLVTLGHAQTNQQTAPWSSNSLSPSVLSQKQSPQRFEVTTAWSVAGRTGLSGPLFSSDCPEPLAASLSFVLISSFSTIRNVFASAPWLLCLTTA